MTPVSQSHCKGLHTCGVVIIAIPALGGGFELCLELGWTPSGPGEGCSVDISAVLQGPVPQADIDGKLRETIVSEDTGEPRQTHKGPSAIRTATAK